MKAQKNESLLLNLLFNIFLPVVILNQGAKHLGEHGPLIALGIALSLPIGYGLYDYLWFKRKNWISLLGFINVAFTGGLAVMKTDGFWFAIKEASFPFIIGVAVLVSAFTSKPLIRLLIWNEAILKTELINQKVKERGSEKDLFKLFKRGTLLFAISFFISSALNLVLALRIFIQIDPTLSELEKSQVLNEQIADMTWQGYIIIALPMMLFMMGVMFYLLFGLKRVSGLNMEEMLNDHQSK